MASSTPGARATTPKGKKNLALLTYDVLRLIGQRVEYDRWRWQFRRGISEESAKRTWARWLERLRAQGDPRLRAVVCQPWQDDYGRLALEFQDVCGVLAWIGEVLGDGPDVRAIVPGMVRRCRRQVPEDCIG